MYFVDNGSAVPVMPQVKPVSSATPQFFTEGGNGTPPTYPGPDWFNIFQLELLNVLKEAQIDPDKENHAQLLAAMKKLFLDASSNGSDIPDKAAFLQNLGLQFIESYNSDSPNAFSSIISPDGKLRIVIANNGLWGVQNGKGVVIPLPLTRGGIGATDVPGAISNLGLGAGLPAIGIPFFWPSAAMPNTVMGEWADMVFLKMNNATFSASQYPKLAKVWPGLKLTDCRGEFIRIADDGRGVDSGRALLSAQGDALQNITGSFLDIAAGPNNNTTGAFNEATLTADLKPTVAGGTYKQANYYFDASRVARTSTETRPRNIAFNFLVRAK